MIRIAPVAAATALLALVGSAGAQTVFVVPMSGAQEVLPVVGDPDAFGTATLTIFPGSPPTITWNIVLFNVDLPINLAHIHSGAAGVNGPVVVDFSGQLTGSGLADPDLQNVLNNPAGFYVNVHNTPHPGGAARGQIPAPASLAALGFAGALLGARRRRT